MDKNLKNNIDELNELLYDELQIKKFNEIIKKLSSNTFVVDRIKKLKELQKRSVFFEAINKEKFIKENEHDILKVKEELLKIPIYEQYVEQQSYIDTEIYNIIGYLNDKILEQLEKDKKEVTINGEI